MERGTRITGWLLGVTLLLGGSEARAVITRLTPLSDVIKESPIICVVRVEKVLPERPGVVLVLREDLKGKLPARRLPVNLTGDREAQKEDHTAKLLRRLAPEMPLVLFASQRGKRFTIFGYSSGTWLQMIGTQGDGQDTLVLSFTHCEPFLRRTFKGSTEALIQVIRDGLTGKKAPPEPDPKEPPGLGPEVDPAKKTGRRHATAGPALAVIPTTVIGGPLAILALLFPALFGGVLVLFRRWAAFFTVVSVVSTLYFLHRWYAIHLAGSWWGTQQAMWMTLAGCTLLGALWAWRRQVTALHQNPAHADRARRTEHVVLWALSLSCLASLAIWYRDSLSSFSDPGGILLLTFTVGVWAGTLYKLYRDGVGRRWLAAPALATEGVMLWGSACAFLAVLTLQGGPRGGATTEMEAGTADRVARLQADQGWQHVFKDNGGGMIVSSPCVVGDRVYVSAAHRQGLATFGVVYCLSRTTHEVLWSFDDEGGMKQVYSSPAVVDGKLYIGEGFHDDPSCKLYCVDAATGKKVWEHQTYSQTEATPTVAGGKVFAGAGNEGILTLDAASGKVLWQYPADPERAPRWRVGAGPAVAGGRLYVGSGVDRNRPDDPGETSVVCLDAQTGKQVWKTKTDLPSWASPVLAGEHLLVSLGNGDVFSDSTTGRPAGALLCLEADTGRQVWRADVNNGVLGRPAVDATGVYFGCRNGRCYRLARADGFAQWQKDLESPILGAPVLDRTDEGETLGVFVASAAGRVACLDPATGKSQWTWHGLEQPGVFLCSTPALALRRTAAGDVRELYFGASLNTLTIPALHCVKDLLP